MKKLILSMLIATAATTATAGSEGRLWPWLHDQIEAPLTATNDYSRMQGMFEYIFQAAYDFGIEKGEAGHFFYEAPNTKVSRSQFTKPKKGGAFNGYTQYIIKYVQIGNTKLDIEEHFGDVQLNKQILDSGDMKETIKELAKQAFLAGNFSVNPIFQAGTEDGTNG